MVLRMLGRPAVSRLMLRVSRCWLAKSLATHTGSFFQYASASTRHHPLANLELCSEALWSLASLAAGGVLRPSRVSDGSAKDTMAD
jgi:hypothetical protein